jgi:hypothetical protein
VSGAVKILPETVERIERLLAGAIVAHPDAIDTLPALEVAHFASAKLRLVWEAAHAVRDRGVLVDLETVADELARRDRLEAVGLAWLAEVVGSAASPAHMAGLATSVREAAVQRAVLIALDDVRVAAGEGRAYGQELLATAMDTLARINADTITDETLSVGAIVRSRMAELEELAQAQANGGIAMTGLPTGIDALDRAIGGWQRGIVSMQEDVREAVQKLTGAKARKAHMQARIYRRTHKSQIKKAQRLLGKKSKFQRLIKLFAGDGLQLKLGDSPLKQAHFFERHALQRQAVPNHRDACTQQRNGSNSGRQPFER